MKHVATLATEVREFAEKTHTAVIGTVGMPKMKPREKYQAARDRAIGSSAWSRKADTIVDIVVDEDTQERDVQILSGTDQFSA